MNDDLIAGGNVSLSDADRIRLVHDYITSADRGGLAIVPGTEKCSRVTDIIAIHNQEFNEMWLRERSTWGIGSLDLDKIKDYVGHLLISPISVSNDLRTLVWRRSRIILPLPRNLHQSSHHHLRSRQWILAVRIILHPLLHHRTHSVDHRFRRVLGGHRAQDLHPVGNVWCQQGLQTTTRLR